MIMKFWIILHHKNKNKNNSKSVQRKLASFFGNPVHGEWFEAMNTDNNHITIFWQIAAINGIYQYEQCETSRRGEIRRRVKKGYKKHLLNITRNAIVEWMSIICLHFQISRVDLIVTDDSRLKLVWLLHASLRNFNRGKDGLGKKEIFWKI